MRLDTVDLGRFSSLQLTPDAKFEQVDDLEHIDLWQTLEAWVDKGAIKVREGREKERERERKRERKRGREGEREREKRRKREREAFQALGVSNFNERQLRDLHSKARIKPAANQVPTRKSTVILGSIVN